MRRPRLIILGWLAISASVIFVSILLVTRRLEAEANAKYSSYQLYRVVALTALGDTPKNNPYGISSGGYGYMRCNFWLGESCSGIIANRSLLESSHDLELVVKAIEEPCKYLSTQAKENDKRISGYDDQSVDEKNMAISTARRFASCDRKEFDGDKSIRAANNRIDRVFISFYEGPLREYRADMVRLAIEIKPSIKSIGDKK